MDEESRKYAFDSGRKAGHAQAVTAAYEVIGQLEAGVSTDHEYHARYLAIMAVIKAIHALDS